MAALFQKNQGEDGNEWMSVSDLMAGLMVIFLFIAIAYIRPVAEKNEQITEIAQTFMENESRIYDALWDEFSGDLEAWDAELDRDSLTVRFRSPKVLFARNEASLTPQFESIIEDFFPRYLKVLGPYKTSIEEIRIEGHTSSEWRARSNDIDAYIGNMGLSQERTRAVLLKCLTLEDTQRHMAWVRPLLTANGLSSSRLVLNDEGVEDPVRSRRVEFRVRSVARTEIIRILEQIE
ncbi:OmpA family protein [Shimia thalassica]|uniref:OmpA family protein n=1 Tax=Shimia thalassica TaxID=1715693 RepID=UPI0026E188BE|nr:OmpA family protein [Shimia thalassica]MDO6479122.1 OmpA family protein [Shimia thalassica]